jgi:hypothetical protein
MKRRLVFWCTVALLGLCCAALFVLPPRRSSPVSAAAHSAARKTLDRSSPVDPQSFLVGSAEAEVYVENPNRLYLPYEVIPQSATPGTIISFVLPPGEIATGYVNLVQKEGGRLRMGGTIQGRPGATFTLSIAADSVDGNIIVPTDGRAYVVSTPRPELVQVERRPINDVVCFQFPAVLAGPPATAAGAQTNGAQPLDAAVPSLSSRPTATAVIYLDFDGETVTDPSWNGGQTINAAASNLSSDDIQRVWALVREDFLPFDVDITTNKSRYDTAPVGKRMRVIVTPTYNWYRLAGGVAYVDSFSLAGSTYSTTIPCFVFNTTVGGVADSISHEVGHTLGLHHDGRTSPAEEYFAGHGSGSHSWGPIMGAPYGVALTQWSKGEYANANNQEDDLAIIASNKNGFGYIADDIGNSRETATAISTTQGTVSLSATKAHLHSGGDEDVFSLTVPATTLYVTVAPPYGIGNADVGATLEDGAGNILATGSSYDVSSSISKVLSAGTYYLRVKSDRYGDVVGSGYVNGYSSYGSIGEYTVSGTVAGPPSPPTIVQQPVSQSVYAGNSASFHVYADGTHPLSFQWQKDGVNIPNTGYSSLYINSATLSDAGNYRVIVTNAAGSAPSAVATLTVTNPPPPKVTSPPVNQTRVEGDEAFFYCSVDSYSPVTFQWYKDDAVLAGKTSYYLSIPNVSSADAGKYKIRASNASGTVYSAEATLTVESAKPPVFSSEPHDVTVEVEGSFSLSGYATSNATVSYQWYKDEVALTNSKSSFLSRSLVTSSDAGTYVLRATTRGGYADSRPASVQVIATKPPQIAWLSGSTSASIGSSIGLHVGVDSVAAVTYQWFRNGQAISGETRSYLYISVASILDFGDYHVRVTNSAGAVDSSKITVSPSNTNTPTYWWSECVEFDGILYFLTKNPGRIYRYDLATQSWLQTWTTLSGPTSITVGQNEVFVGYGRTLTRYDKNFANAQTWSNFATDVTKMFVTSNALIASMADGYNIRLVSLSLTAPTQIASTTTNHRPLLWDSSKSRLIGILDWYPYASALDVSTSGAFGTATAGAYAGTFTWIVPVNQGSNYLTSNGLVLDAPTLTIVGPTSEPLVDAAPYGNEIIGLRGMQLTRFDSKYRETTSANLNAYSQKVVVRANEAIVFSQPTSSGSPPVVQIVRLADFAEPTPAPLTDPNSQPYTPTEVIMDGDGVVYLYSKKDRNVHRWSSLSNRYLSSLALASQPSYIAYSASHRALYFNSGPRTIRKLSLTSPSPKEEPFALVNSDLRGIQSADSNIFYSEGANTWATHGILDSRGEVLQKRDWSYYSDEYVWSPVNKRMYFFRDGMSPNIAIYESISDQGVIDSAVLSPSNAGVKHPLRVSPDGSVVLIGSGRILDGTTLAYLNALANDISDGTWSSNLLHTIRPTKQGTEVQSWASSNYLLQRSANVEGTPLRILSLAGSRLLVITMLNGFPKFTVLQSASLLAASPRAETAAQDSRLADFNGDGSSDIIVQNLTTGERAVWLMSGTMYSGLRTISREHPDWEIAGYGDFNQDRRPDLLWENRTTGERVVWFMNGTVCASQAWLTSSPAGWNVAGVGDFNGDDAPDLIIQNSSTGGNAIQILSGTEVAETVNLGTESPSWKIVGTGDFNADNQLDIVWQNTSTGERVLSIMTGTTRTQDVNWPTQSSDWLICGVSDLNGDRKPDLVESNRRTGERAIRLMNGILEGEFRTVGSVHTNWIVGRPLFPSKAASSDMNGDGIPDLLSRDSQTGVATVTFCTRTGVGTSQTLANESSDWEIAATGDFDRNGRIDLVWQNNQTGDRVIRLLGENFSGTDTYIGSESTNWRIVASGDFNKDDYTDLVWQNIVTGDRVIRLMNGTNTIVDSWLARESLDWQIRGVGDLDGDGNADIVWQNVVSGDRVISRMDGTSRVVDIWLPSQANTLEIVGVGDFNRDGYLDFIERNASTREVTRRLMRDTVTLSITSLGFDAAGSRTMCR